jgi:hypothetical membrane protein
MSPVFLRSLACVSAIAPVAFLTIATLAGWLQPGYDLRTNSISESALGPFGWLQTLNFYAFGLSIVAFAISFARGLRTPARVVAIGLLVVAGLAVAANGLYPTDRAGAEPTSAGELHNLLGLTAFVAMIASQASAAWAMRREPGWGGYAILTTFTATAAFGLLALFIGFSSDPGDPLYAIGGLVERALALVVFGWMSVVSLRQLQEVPASRSSM